MRRSKKPMGPSLSSNANPAPGKSAPAKGILTPVLLGWGFAIFLMLIVFDPTEGFTYIGNDDAMRLVQVRDLIGGQGWFDTTQYRLGLDGGTPMHWSRLVDAPIAALILSLNWAIGQPAAEIAAMTLWPLLLIGPVMFATALMANALGGRPAAFVACAISVSAVHYYGKFHPGSLDHHNVQIALLTVAIAGVVLLAHGPRFAALTGAAVAASHSVGVEFVPQMAIVCAAVAVIWAWRGASIGPAAFAFSLALAIVLAILFVATAPAAAYRGGFCDALSTDLAIPVLAGAGGLAVLSRTRSQDSRPVRLAALGVLGVLVVILAALTAPACLSRPYGNLDPLLQKYFLGNISEVRPMMSLIMENYGLLQVAFLGIIAPIISLHMGLRGENGDSWFFLAAMTFACFLLAAYQIRWVPALAVVAVLPPSVFATKLYMRSRAQEGLAAGLCGIALLTLIIPHVWYAVRRVSLPLAAESESPLTAKLSCRGEGSFDTLASLPPGLISTSMGLGAHILRYTPHRVLAAPYHRNQEGLSTEIRIAMASNAEAERLLRASGVDYVVYCDQDPGFVAGSARGKEQFLSDLARGEVPSFLERVGTEDAGPLIIYRLRAEE